VTDEFTAAAPPDPEAQGTGETSFADAEAPPASERAAVGSPGGDPVGSPGGDPKGDSAGADSPEAVEADLAALAARAKERDEYLALAQRTQADFENYRKRMARENAAAQDRGVAKVAKELLPALDHLEHALKAASGHEDVVKGFALVRDEIVAALGRAGIQPFSPQGDPFDPNEHEAMTTMPSEDAESGTVVEVYQQGYRLNGAVLRPARVVVAE
jgi:molecular chaperone GrpE